MYWEESKFISYLVYAKESVMLVVKSNEQAAKFREIGNQLLKEGKNYEALVTFNKSLCFAGPESLEMAFAFEARSEVYQKIGQYQKCLKNLEAARVHGYPADLIGKLEQRKKECEKIIQEGFDDSLEEISNFVKLSHPANEKIPFLIDGLEVRHDEKFGRYVISTRDLIPGDVIAIEESFLHFISPKSIFSRCFNCFKSNMLDLLPSSASVMFCSENCYQEAVKKFGAKESFIQDSLCGNDIRQKMLRIMSESLNAAGSFDELQQLVRDANGETIFDFDFSESNADINNKNILKCLWSSLPKSDCNIQTYIEESINIAKGELRDFFVNYVNLMILKYMRNGVKVPGKNSNFPEGGMMLPLVTLFNHSCDPNIFASFFENKCIMFVMKKVKAGEQLFLNYRKTFIEQIKEQRQSELLIAYEFICDCKACAYNYPKPNKLPKIDSEFILPKFGKFGTNHDLTEELKKNFEYMMEKNDRHPCFETAAILIRNRELLREICERVSFPISVDSERIASH